MNHCVFSFGVGKKKKKYVFGFEEPGLKGFKLNSVSLGPSHDEYSWVFNESGCQGERKLLLRFPEPPAVVTTDSERKPADRKKKKKKKKKKLLLKSLLV